MAEDTDLALDCFISVCELYLYQGWQPAAVKITKLSALARASVVRVPNKGKYSVCLYC